MILETTVICFIVTLFLCPFLTPSLSSLHKLEKYLAEAKDSYDKMYNEMKAWYQPDRIVVKQGRRLLHTHPEGMLHLVQSLDSPLPSLAFKLLTEKAQLLGYAQDVRIVINIIIIVLCYLFALLSLSLSSLVCHFSHSFSSRCCTNWTN